jgi:hypothetical protein
MMKGYLLKAEATEMTKMSNSHNKKRNSGLLYEFLVATISEALVDGNQKLSASALKILKKHFKPGTELYKEFRLINSLMKTTVSCEAVASSILQEAKSAARAHDVSTLDKEKSFLIHNINHAIADENFYDKQVNEYRMLATIQTLINDWRAATGNLERQAKYEDQLVKWLMTEKQKPAEQIIAEDSPGTGRLLMKVMMKKLNEKYAGVLNNEQKQLIKAYAFSAANDEQTSIRLKLCEVKDSLLESIERYNVSHHNEYLNKKLDEAKKQLEAETIDRVDDDTVTRFMLYTKLSSELNAGDDND